MSVSRNGSVCALIPTYNRAAMLRECIGSILTQSRSVQEIIVINDGSTDNTIKVIESYGNRITLINKPNGGKSSALNLGLQHCQSDYVWICDDDDLAAPNGLKHLAEALDADETAGFVFGTYKVFSDAKIEHTYSEPPCRPRDEEPNIKLRFLEGMFTNQFAMLVRRALYDEVGLFHVDLIRSQDYDMALRLSRKAKALSIPKVIFYYREHNATRGSAKDTFSSDLVREKWLAYDEKILTRVRAEYALKEFTPTFALNWNGARETRAALVERACISAERALWIEAAADITQACDASDAPPEPQEIKLAETVIRQAIAWDTLAENPDAMKALYVCYKKNAYGRAIVFAMCRPPVWLARERFRRVDLGGGLRLLRVAHGVLGLRGAGARFMSSAFDTKLTRRIKHGLSWRWRSFSHYTAGPRFATALVATRWRLAGRGRAHGLPAPLVVSLTSYPARFPTLALTLRSLLRQTIKADHTILWIAHADYAALPREILDLQKHGLEIRTTENTRSYKKILPTLDAFPDAFIATADDDIYYVPTWLEEMARGVEPDMGIVPCHRAHAIESAGDGYAPYAQWRFNIPARGKAQNLFPTGCAGILYPPHILAHRAEDRQGAFDLCPHADDVWLYWIGRRNGARYKTIGKHREHIMWDGSQHICLYQDNLAGGRNDEQIRKIAEKYGYPDISDEA